MIGLGLAISHLVRAVRVHHQVRVDAVVSADAAYWARIRATA